MRVMHIEARIRHTADYAALWESIPHEGISTGARGTDYLLTFNGDAEVGKKIVDGLISEGHCTATIIMGY